MNTQQPDWALASPQRIEQALEATQRRGTGGWFALEFSERAPTDPKRYQVDGHELVMWRSEGELVVSPAACPHMGADLATGRVCRGKLVCPWHGLALPARGRTGWRPYPVHDDGQLVWVQMPAGDEALPRPILVERPTRRISAGHQLDLACDPQDVIANRLDPWHGAHLHPHSFSQLAVVDGDDEAFGLDVEVKVGWSLTTRARVTFHCPTARSIVMSIVDGVGKGSVLETHATPIAPGRTRVLETMSATSDHPLFRPLSSSGLFRRVLRQRLVARARRLWVEDAEYAERRCLLRGRKTAHRPPLASPQDEPVGLPYPI
ncbi:MAG: Rieske 2Fe-2S domain-containing protein [Myxococcales bacterium FL481]|nr:MAG: Rieske 2Fe-2S domain-containing protein [Myxococcales bacterium FL481]